MKGWMIVEHLRFYNRTPGETRYFSPRGNVGSVYLNESSCDKAVKLVNHRYGHYLIAKKIEVEVPDLPSVEEFNVLP